ncbi:MAG: helix-turn-helix domain-containing protein [Ilumatobacteraceae bacterium]
MAGTRRHGEARDRLVATAAGLFYAEGIHAVGVDRIVDAAGVAKATMYQHFTSKDELVVACVQLHAARWRDHVAVAARRRTGKPAERVAFVFDLLAKGFVDPAYRGCPFINTAAEYPEPDGSVAMTIAAHRLQVRALFVELLAPVAAARRRECADQLLLIYDGSLVGAQHGAGAKVGRTARRAARTLVEAAMT